MIVESIKAKAAREGSTRTKLLVILGRIYAEPTSFWHLGFNEEHQSIMVTAIAGKDAAKFVDKYDGLVNYTEPIPELTSINWDVPEVVRVCGSVTPGKGRFPADPAQPGPQAPPGQEEGRRRGHQRHHPVA